MRCQRLVPVIATLIVLGTLTHTLSLPATAGPADGDERELQEGVRTDLYGDPLPAGAVARMGTVRFRHHDVIFSLAVSPDGKTVASAGTYHASSLHGVIRLWDLNTGKEIRQLTGNQGPAGWVVFSPDGKTIASSDGGSNPRIRLWDLSLGKEVLVLRGYPDAVRFSPDGKTFVSWGTRDTVRLWDVASGKMLRQFPGRFMAFSLDGKELVTTRWIGGGKSTIYFWEVATGKERDAVREYQHPIKTLLVSPDGKTIVAGTGTGPTVRWCERATGRQVRQVRGELLASTSGRKGDSHSGRHGSPALGRGARQGNRPLPRAARPLL